MQRTFWRLRLAVLGIVTLTGALLPGTALAVEQPGGKRIYAVTVGQVAPQGTAPTGKEFSRLAMYYFNGDGTVRQGFWFWSWTKGYGPANVGVTSAGCDAKPCQVHTAKGFQDGVTAEALAGTYTTSGNQLSISWSNGATEKWVVARPETGLSAIALTGSNYGANVGQGYGSNVSSDTAVPLNKVPRKLYQGRYAHNLYDQTTGRLGSATAESEIDLSKPDWKPCSGNCLSAYFPASANVCKACGAGEARVNRYYLASRGGRKNFYEHFCTCLLQGSGGTRCYEGRSHLKPQLQVIDDAGALRGWVGVEAQHWEPQRGTLGVNWHVAL